MIHLRSQLFFKRIFPRFPTFRFTSIPADVLNPSPIVQEPKPNLINDNKPVKTMHEYFTIYNKHEKLFQTQGLLNHESESIKSSLAPQEISVIAHLKKWFQGKIDFNQLSIKQTDCFINITLMLLNRLKGNQQIVTIVQEFEKKLDQIIERFTIAENNLRQGLLVLKYLKTRKNTQLFDRLKKKIKEFLNSDKSKGQKMSERIFQQLSVYGGFDDIIIDIFCQYPVEKILKREIYVENLPYAYFNNHVQLLSQHVEHLFQNESYILATSRIVKIVNMLNHFQDDKYAINALITIIYSLIKRKGDKSNKYTVDIVNEILSKQRSSLILFYVLNYYDVNSSKILDIGRYMPFSQQPLLNKAILSIIIHKTKNINKDYAKLIKAQIDTCFTTFEAFLSLYNAFRLINLPKFVQFFAEIHHKSFRALPNPFEAYKKQPMLENKSLFLEFFFKTYPYKDKQIFLKRYEEQINVKLVEEILSLHLQQSKTKFIIDKYYNYLLLIHFEEAIKQKNVKLLQLGLQFLEVYRKAGVERTQNQFTELKIWKLIGKYITNLSIIKELGLEQALYNMILGYIKVEDAKNYKHDYHYKRMIWDLIKEINNIAPQHEIHHLIIREALAYDQINKFNLDILRNVELNENKLTKGELLKFACLKGQKIVLDVIKEDDIEALLVNGSVPQYQEIIDKNIDHIMKLLSTAKQSVIFSCLSSYNRQRSANNDKILNFLLESATKLSQRDIHKIDFITVFNKCLKLGYFNIPNYLIFWNQIIQHLCFKLHRLTINSHIKLMQFLHTQPVQLINKQLVMKYLHFIRKFCNEQIVVYTNTITTLYYMLTISNLPSSRTKMQQIWERMKHTGFVHLHFHELLLILIQEEYLSADFMKAIIHKYDNYVKELQRRQIMCPNYQFIYDLHYRYLKMKYPDLMKRLVLDEKRLQQYIFTQSHPRIFVSTINLVCSLLSCPWEFVTTYNAKNKIIKIKETLLVFLSPYKNGCLKEHQLIIKMLKVLENNENMNIVIIKYYDPSTYELDLINSIYKQSSLLTRQQRDSLIASIKQQKTEKIDISKVQVESRQEEIEKDEIQVGDESDQIIIQEDYQEDNEHSSDEI